jgi:mRNA-degrading endonuclease toxin of MazEF toxin-antitoxin module
MSPVPLIFVRGSIYRIRFESDDHKRAPIIEKYCLCLQQGSIIHNRSFFVGALLTTCKDNSKPRTFQWSVYISPSESRTEFGVLVDCSQLYTIPKADVIKFEYSLDPETMEKVDQALQFGIGVLRVEDLKKLHPSE